MTIARLKPVLAIGVVLLALPALFDAWRLSSKAPPVLVQSFVYTSFEKFAYEARDRAPLLTAAQGKRPGQLRENAQDHLRQEPLTGFALPLAPPGAPFESADGLKIAEQVSRREPQVQLQLATLGAQQGDLALSLAHLNKALIVDTALSETILPSLVPALSDAHFRRTVIKYAQQPWFWLFAKKAAGVQAEATNAANLFSELGNGVRNAPRGFVPIILNSLLAEGRTEAARAVVRGGALITEKDFDTFAPNAANSNPDLAPLTWRLTKSEKAYVSLDQRRGWYAEIEAGRTAILLERVMLFEPGRYRVEIPYAGEGKPTLSLSCFNLSRAIFGHAFGKDKLLSLEFSIPKGCPAQLWSISVSEPDNARPQVLYGNGAMTVRRI